MFVKIYECSFNFICGCLSDPLLPPHRRLKLFAGSLVSSLTDYRARRWCCLVAMVMSDDAIELVLQKWAWAKGEEAAMKLSYVKRFAGSVDIWGCCQ